MSFKYLEKYPVVSVEGNEYLVSIRPSMAYGKVEVRLYTKAKGWFGRERFNQIGTGCSNYGEKEWNYDYIRMAINEVIGYENDNKGRQKHRASQKKAAEAFEKWDGIEVAE